MPAVAVEPSAVQVLLDGLKAEGVRVVFGVPGGLLHPFFDAVERDGDLDLVVVKHEQGAAFMADGYARTGGGLAVAAATSGPGATNLVTGVAVAHADGVPMLVLTGQANSATLGRGAAQESARPGMDIVGMLSSVTKYSATVSRADRVGFHLTQALRAAWSGRPGPVHLNVPVDLWRHPCPPIDAAPGRYRPVDVRYVSPAELERAAEVLASARTPCILAGSGATSPAARRALMRLAEQLGARVATTPRAKGCFPEDHPLSLGVLGFAGHREAKRVLVDEDPVDALFVVGASLGETTTFNWDPRLARSARWIQLDVDPARIGRGYPVDVAVVGHAEVALAALSQQFSERMALRTWRARPLPARGEARFDGDEAALRASTSVPVTPQRWRRELVDVLPPDAMIFSDIGGHMLLNLHHLEVTAGQSFVLNLGFGSMGHGTAAPIGARLAHPDRPIVAIVGDGCFAMNGMELITAVEYDLPVVWIVENNQMHGITHHGSRMVSGRAMTSIRYRRPLNVAGLARAMGVRTWQVQRPGEIGPALTAALACGAPALIDVFVDREVPPPLGDRARTIAGIER